MAGFPTMAVLFLVYGAIMLTTQVVPTAAGMVVAVPSDPWFNQTLPPQPRPGFYKYLGDCIETLTKPCGLEMANYVFKNKAIRIPCCTKVKVMGQLCSKSLSFTLTQIQKFIPLAKQIIQKSDVAY